MKDGSLIKNHLLSLAEGGSREKQGKEYDKKIS
jgi:hypothetical protein